MRISICDDDQFILEELKKYLEEYYSQEDYDMPELVAFSDGNALLADEGKKDIVFLDIEMPGLDGIFVGNMLKKKYPDIFIFIITAYDEYLDAAMDAHVFRYLRKPVEKNRLFQSLKIAMRRYYCLVSDIMIDQGNTFKNIRVRNYLYRSTGQNYHFKYCFRQIFLKKYYSCLDGNIECRFFLSNSQKLHCQSEICFKI